MSGGSSSSIGGGSEEGMSGEEEGEKGVDTDTRSHFGGEKIPTFGAPSV